MRRQGILTDNDFKGGAIEGKPNENIP